MRPVTSPRSSTADGQSVPFTVDVDGDLVGRWGPDTGFPVCAGLQRLHDVRRDGRRRCPDRRPTPSRSSWSTSTLPRRSWRTRPGTITVNDNAATVLWGDPAAEVRHPGLSTQIPLRVYAPAAGTGELTLTVTGPGDDPTTPRPKPHQAGDVKVYASNGTDMVRHAADPERPGPARGHLGRHARGRLQRRDLVRHGRRWERRWATTPSASAWPAATPSPDPVAVFAPESHGEQPPGSGEDTTAPVVTVTPVGDLGATAVFTLAANEDGVTFECMLEPTGRSPNRGHRAPPPRPTRAWSRGPTSSPSAGRTGRARLGDRLPDWTVLPDTTPPVVTMTPPLWRAPRRPSGSARTRTV